MVRDTPGVDHTVGISGQSLILGANAPEPGLDVRHARRTSPSAAAPALTADAIAAAIRERCQREVQGRDRVGLRRAAHRRPGHHRRLQADHRGPRQPRPRQTCSASAIRSSPAATTRRACTACSTAPGPTRPGCTWTSTAPSAWPWACRSATSSTRCRSISARIYVNNFNEFGRTWQVNVQADQRFRDQVPDILQLQVRNNQGQMIRLGTLMDVRDTSGPVMVMRYNMYSATAITGNTAAGHQLRPGHRADAGDRRQAVAAVDGLRLDRTDLPAASGGQRGDLRLRPGRGVRVPGAGRPVRKLVAAAGRDPGRAHVPAVLRHRRACWPAWT